MEFCHACGERQSDSLKLDREVEQYVWEYHCTRCNWHNRLAKMPHGEEHKTNCRVCDLVILNLPSLRGFPLCGYCRKDLAVK